MRSVGQFEHKVLLFGQVLLSRTWFLEILTLSQEHLVAERGCEENFEHGRSEEEKNEIEVLIHEEPKQAYDGDGRGTVVENGSYGEPE